MSAKDGTKKPSISEILSGRLDSLKGALKAGIPHDLIKPVRVLVTLKSPTDQPAGLTILSVDEAGVATGTVAPEDLEAFLKARDFVSARPIFGSEPDGGEGKINLKDVVVRAEAELAAAAEELKEALGEPPEISSPAELLTALLENLKTSGTRPLASNIDPRIIRHVQQKAGFELKVGEDGAVSADITHAAEVELVEVVVRLKDPSIAVEGLEVERQRGRLITGRVAVADLEKVKGHSNIASISLAPSLHAHLEHSVADMRADPATLQRAFPAIPGLDGTGVIVGVIDVGADIAHPNFRNPDGTSRLISLWDQGNSFSKPPEGFSYGREFSRADLDSMLSETNPYSSYGKNIRSSSHGTTVMDVAAGNGLGTGMPGVAPGADLIFVDVTAPRKGGPGTGKQLAHAAEYIFEKAAALKRPAVINISLGTGNGSRDGKSFTDEWLDELLSEPDRAIVVSAGNDRTMRLHSGGNVAAGVPTLLSWNTVPMVGSYVGSPPGTVSVEVWYSSRQALSVSLIRGSKRYGPVGPGESQDFTSGSEDTPSISIHHIDEHPDNGDRQILIMLNPSLQLTWQIELTCEAGPVRYDAWIERVGNPANQTQFLMDSEDRRGTLGALSCGKRTIVVGAYKTGVKGRPAASYSSEGPTRDGRQKPDVLAPGQFMAPFFVSPAPVRSYRLSAASVGRDPISTECFQAAEGKELPKGLIQLDSKTQLSMEEISGMLGAALPNMGIAAAIGGSELPVRQAGTSLAAPHVVGLIAMLLQAADRSLTAEEIRSLVVDGVCQPEQAWSPQCGMGRVDAVGSLKALLGSAEEEVVAPQTPELTALVEHLTQLARRSKSRIRFTIDIDPTDQD